MHYRNLWLILGALYIGLIVAGSLLRETSIDMGTNHIDKVVHFLTYFILVGWFVQLYAKFSSRIVILMAAILLGMLIEYLQGMTSYRSFDLLDQAANSMGAICAFILTRTTFDSLLSSFDQWLYKLKSS